MDCNLVKSKLRLCVSARYFFAWSKARMKKEKRKKKNEKRKMKNEKSH